MITGFFHPGHPDAPLPLIQASIFIPGVSRDWANVLFLLDTGASATSLHPDDAMFRLFIPEARLAAADRWDTVERLRGVGGGAAYYIQPCTYGLQHMDNSWQIINGQIRIAQLREDNRGLPSLLGWDILSGFEITLDHDSGTVLLK